MHGTMIWLLVLMTGAYILLTAVSGLSTLMSVLQVSQPVALTDIINNNAYEYNRGLCSLIRQTPVFYNFAHCNEY